MPQFTTSKLKSGERVYRLIGRGHELRCDDDGSIYYVDRRGPFEPDGPFFKRISITRDNLDDKDIKDLLFSKWEFLLLERGPDVVERELREALAEKGHAVEVKIGRGGAGDGTGSGSAYNTSIRVKPLSRTMPSKVTPGSFADTALLAELGAISNELTDVHATVNGLALRLRVLIAMTLKAKL